MQHFKKEDGGVFTEMLNVCNVGACAIKNRGFFPTWLELVVD